MAAVILSAASAARAAVIVDSQGFESPLFDTTFGPGGPGTGSGQLEGQTPSTFNGTWLRTKGPGLSTANVQTTVVDSGSQAVRVDRVSGSDDFWGVPVDGYPSIGQQYVCISWSMTVDLTATPVGSFGPFFGVDAYDDDATSLGRLATLGVDAANGEVLIIDSSGNLVAPGPTVSLGTSQWNDYLIELNYGTNQARYFLNGSLIATDAFVDQDLPGGLNEFTDANIATFAAGGDAGSQAATGTAYFDNFTVSESTLPCDVPEPAAGVLAVAGAAILGRLRRGAKS